MSAAAPEAVPESAPAAPAAVATPAPESGVPAVGEPAPSATATSAEPAVAPKEGEQAAAAPTTPTEYGDFALPAGYAPTDESMGRFKTWAAEQKLSQDQAQAYLNLDATRMQERRTQFEAAIKQQDQEWAEQIQKDPVLGKLPHETKTRVDASMRFFLQDDPAALQFLQESGWDKHPGFVKLMYRAHDAIKHMAPDGFGPTSAPVGRERTLAERLAPEFAK